MSEEKSNIVADINEKMINTIEGKKGYIKKILYGLMFIIPIIVTFLLTKMFFQIKEDEKKVNITKDPNPEVYGESNKEDTKIIDGTEKLDNTLNDINNTIHKKI